MYLQENDTNECVPVAVPSELVTKTTTSVSNVPEVKTAQTSVWFPSNTSNIVSSNPIVSAVGKERK